MISTDCTNQLGTWKGEDIAIAFPPLSAAILFLLVFWGRAGIWSRAVSPGMPQYRDIILCLWWSLFRSIRASFGSYRTQWRIRIDSFSAVLCQSSFFPNERHKARTEKPVMLMKVRCGTKAIWEPQSALVVSDHSDFNRRDRTSSCYRSFRERSGNFNGWTWRKVINIHVLFGGSERKKKQEKEN